MLERLGKWQAAALQELLDIFDLPAVSKGTKVGSCCWCTAAHVCCFAALASDEQLHLQTHLQSDRRVGTGAHASMQHMQVCSTCSRHWECVCVCAPAFGVQEEKMERALEFLEKPHQASDKDLAAKVGLAKPLTTHPQQSSCA
jgi:hypothetical protein